MTKEKMSQTSWLIWWMIKSDPDICSSARVTHVACSSRKHKPDMAVSLRAMQQEN